MKKEEHNARFRDHYIAIGIRISPTSESYGG